jgi:hypothetical protein
MLGAIATASVSASRQADGGDTAGAACSGAGLSLVAVEGFPAAGLAASAAGASAGRGFGNGTDAGDKARRSFGL